MSSYPEKNGPIHRVVPDGDNVPRLVCKTCGYIEYNNPKVVVGSVAIWKDKILLCKRAIEPRIGYWTLPAGYLELNESTEMGAKREAQEEAGAELKIQQLLAIYNIPRISQIQLIYVAKLINNSIFAGPESAEVKLYEMSDIPWSDLAFPSVHWAISQYQKIKGKTVFQPFTNPEDDSSNITFAVDNKK